LVEEEKRCPIVIFLGALLKFTIEKLFILPVLLLILYSREIITMDSYTTNEYSKITYEFA